MPATKRFESLKRGSYEGRWEVYANDGKHIGWVVRNDDRTWDAYVSMPRGVQGHQVGWGHPTRREAVAEVAIGREVW